MINIILIFAGSLLRLIPYCFNRSLWFDELKLALVIIRNPLSEIPTAVAVIKQGAPIGFCLATKLSTVFFGTGEQSLRLLPLLCGLASLPLFWMVARHFLTRGAVPVALAFFAVSGRLIYYASEVKPYGVDVFVCLLILLLAVRMAETSPNWRSVLVAGSGGAVLLWFSYPAAFFLAGTAITLSLQRLFQRDYRASIRFLPAFAAWAASFYLVYQTSAHRVIDIKGAESFWSQAFMPLSPFTAEAIQWLINKGAELLAFPMALSLRPAAALFILIGLIRITSRSKTRGLFLTIPVLLLLWASAAELYPVQGRLVLFLVPAGLLLLAEGLCAFKINGRPRLSAITIALVVSVMLAGPAMRTTSQVMYNANKEETRSVLSRVQDHWNESDILYVYRRARYAFAYYRDKFIPANSKNLVVEKSAQRNFDWSFSHLSQFKQKKRVWFFFAHVPESDKNLSEERKFLRFLDQKGIPKMTIRSEGASAYLYDFSQWE